MKIGNRIIAKGESVFIVAEMSTSHGGSLKVALDMVEAAKKAGADALKVQFFDPEGFCTPYAEWKGQNQLEMFRKYALSATSVKAIAEECRRQGLVFFATPQGGLLGTIGRAPFLVNECGAPCLKVGSDDLTFLPMLRALSNIPVPIILSSGMASEDDVWQAIRQLQTQPDKHPDAAILVCTSMYPTPMDHAELWRIPWYSKAFGLPIGFSDHTISRQAPAYAVAAGACIIEKHFTIPSGFGPDHEYSAMPEDFRIMVENIRSAEDAMHYGPTGVVGKDFHMREHARRSIVANRHIKAGESIHSFDLGYKRPGTGLAPEECIHLFSRVAKRDIMKDEQIQLDDVT